MKKYLWLVFIVIVLVGLSIMLFQIYRGDRIDQYAPVVSNTEGQVDQNINPEVTGADETTPINSLDNKKVMNATLKTNKGDIKIEFFATDAPKTVENFTKLASSSFYNGVRFHRVIKGFMIQGGDPLSKDDSKASMWGTGGPGYKFADEIDANSDLYTKVGYKKGIVAMANSGPNTNGSQFFIMHADYPLPPLYTIFGKVVAGQSVVDAIALVKTGPNDRPLDPITIESITLE
mgnify:CR=1 FL=1